MKKIILIITLLAVAIIATFYFQNNNKIEAISDKPIVKIGISLPLTGFGADNAISIQRISEKGYGKRFNVIQQAI